MFTSSSPVNKCNINVTTRKPIKKRPQVCITENYIKQQENQARKPDVVPGNRSYASATKYGKKIQVIGGSHVRGMKRNTFNDSFENPKGHIKAI